MSDVYVGECRRGHTVLIPCNWNKGGYCGEDAKLCVVRDVHENRGN